MAAYRNLSARKVLRFLLTAVGVTGLAVAVSSATHQQEAQRLRGVDIRVVNAQEAGFLNRQSLKEMLFTRRHLSPSALTMGKADVHRLENIALSNPWVQSAQVYVDHRRVLHVQVTQRIPFVRVFETSGDSYYLDTALQQLPLSEDFVYYAPVVTGVPHMLDSTAKKAVQEKILCVAGKLGADPFWKQGVEEIVVRPDGEFELIPVLGNHRALIGDTSHIDAKLHTLFLFYRNVLNRIGWDRYTVLDARYNNQVVASPSLPWKPPTDRALSNMNWVKTIVKEDIPDTVSGPKKSGLSANAAPPKIIRKTTAAFPSKPPPQKPRPTATSQPAARKNSSKIPAQHAAPKQKTGRP